jgi:hypothetical protein
MSLIALAIVVALPAGRSLYLRRKEKQHEEWLDDMAGIGAKLMCDEYVPGLQKKMLDLQARAEQLVGEPVECRVGYPN